MQRVLLLLVFIFGSTQMLRATGEPSTYFNIYIPPNNDAVKRNVALIVTAIYDNTTFSIIDDDMDGDDDDSYSGVLMAGQSYVLYIKDNGINDDAKYASGGTLKPDGDYFTITSSQLVYASQSTDSDWQFDYVPSVNKSSVGQRFIVYAPKRSSSNRDLNVFAYDDNTTVTIKVISTSSHMQTGLNTVDINQDSVVVQRTLNIGEDLIHFYQDGRDVMTSGHTYLVEANKPVSVQYGALHNNSRDGGGYVPSSNGSSSGDLFYFTVPYQSGGEQEIRIVSWDSNNTVQLERFNNGSWTSVKNWTLTEMQTADWVGKDYNVSYSTVFRVSSTSGKKVSVFTANWLETGNPGTSDIATMASSKDGTAAGKEFLCYMAPPGNEHNVIDPFTGELFGGQFTHLYFFARDTTTVIVKDAFTDGQDFSKTFTILPGRYADCALSLAEWQSIYNGDGKANSGSERPYLHVTADKNISVMNTNFNDNWMMYFGSSLAQSFTQNSNTDKTEGIPGDSVTVVSDIIINSSDSITGVSGKVTIGSGAIPTSSVFVDSTNMTSTDGVITTTTEGSEVVFNNLPNLYPENDYQIITTVQLLASENDGSPIEDNAVITVETAVEGLVDGVTQQSITTEGISNNVTNASNLIYAHITDGILVSEGFESWNSSWADIDNDGDDDLLVSSNNLGESNVLYENSGNGTFSKIINSELSSTNRKTMSSSWADFDNDGDVDVLLVNNNYFPLELYTNNGSGSFTKENNSGINTVPGYYHGAQWLDVNNDGWLDLFVTNYMPTKFHELYINQGDGTFVQKTDDALTANSSYTVSATSIDYDNDGYTDLFLPSNQGANNLLFRNTGNGFEKVNSGEIANDGGNSVASCWGDVDNDGHLDLFVSNSSGQKDFFYWNNGDGTFSKDTTLAFSSLSSNTHGCEWLDVDNDMDIDLYLTDDQGAKKLYIQNADGTFTNKIDEIAVTNYGASYGVASADFNNDGFIDMFVSTRNTGNNHLWKNNGNDKNHLTIKLVGTASNISAIGTRIELIAGGTTQTHFVTSQSGMGSQSSLSAHFGLDTLASADSIIVHWPSGLTQTVTEVNANQFITITEDASSKISGTLYRDMNFNCVMDANEPVIGDQEIIVAPNGKTIKTNNSGYFETRLAAGNYNITYPNTNYWESLCDTQNISVTSTPAVYDELNIGLNALADGHDLEVNYQNTAWRRGFVNESVIVLKNKGTSNAYSQTLSLQLPAGLYVNTASKSYNTTSNGEITWLIDFIPYGGSVVIALEDSVGLEVLVGDTMQLSLALSGNGNELNPTDNVQLFEDEVVGAIDPNDLLSWPGQTKNGMVWIEKSDSILFKIRFQNVGTFAAENVRLQTKLSQNFDFSSLKLLNASHDVITEYDNEGNVNWWFKKINLPDSNTNEQASHGYAMFSIKPSNFARPLDEMRTSVSIVFDFEEAIITNTITHKIVDPSTSDLQLIVFPNPCSTNSTVAIHLLNPLTNTNSWLTHFTIYSLDGRTVYSESINGAEHSMNASDLKPGVYLFEVEDANGERHQTKLIKQ